MTEILSAIIDFVLHLDKHLGAIVQDYGVWTYGLLFLIVFLETGAVITPFLPGDSLIFAAAAISAQGFLNPLLLFVLLVIAGIAGDAVNYWIGSKVGGKIFERDRPLINEEYLKRTQNFYEKHGKKTIIIARFLPIIRTFAPFIAGVGKMHYPTFAAYNIVGAILWVGIFTVAGFFFGNVPFVQDNFAVTILAIIVISLIPAFVELYKHRRNSEQNNEQKTG